MSCSEKDCILYYCFQTEKRSMSHSKGHSKSRKNEVLQPLSTLNNFTTVPWSPYGCHYYPDTSEFPEPKLDSLPPDPLRKGEQYYLDLGGNIRKVIFNFYTIWSF